LRTHTRHDVELDVGLDAADGIFSGFLENLSQGGAFVATHMVRPVGEVVELSVYTAEGNVLFKGIGEVRWLRNHNEVSDLPPGMGVKFLELESAARHRMEGFLVQAAASLT
jgi:uncharacterized protein (TIGR02266 family)